MISTQQKIWVGVCAALMAAGGAPALAQTDTLNVVVTTSMIADAIGRVGGDRVTVTALMGPGVDPHAYRQTRADIAAMTNADAVIWHGLFLEAQLEDFFNGLGESKPVIALAEMISADKLLGSEDYPDRFDPHVWMDPVLWMEVVAAARDTLAELDPDGAAIYVTNADMHLAEISELADYARNVLGTVPQESRVLITAHDAFNYFGAAYDYEVLGVQGISTESEAGLAQIEALVGLLVEREIGAIFVESSVSHRNVMALVEGAAAQGHEVVIGGELFSDAMGAPGTYEGNYIGMIDHNVTTIARALGGDAPESGVSAKLNQ